MSTWEARERAATLAFSLGSSMTARRDSDGLCVRSPRKQFSVRFTDEVQVFLGDADSLRMRQFCTSTFNLHSWMDKPWARRPSMNVRPILTTSPFLDLCHIPRDVPAGQQCKIIDNHGRPEGFSADGSAHDFPARGDRNAAPPRAPDFTDNIVNAVRLLAIPVNQFPNNFLELRTWYVTHEHPRRHWNSRLLTLVGDQSTWIDQIRAVWAEVIDPDAPIAYQICDPQPPRGPNEQWVALDIILSQGLQLRRYSGLVTVAFLDDLEGARRFTVATSLPAVVSGYLVVDAVDLHHLCSPISPRRCSIFHGWTPIPVTAEGVHLMRSGHTFIVFVPANSEDDPAYLVQAPQIADRADQTFATVPDVDMQSASGTSQSSQGSDDDDNDDGYDPGTPVPEDDPLPQDALVVFNCHVYRLHHPPMHLFLNHVSGVPLLWELAHVFDIPRESLVTSHAIRERMVGQHDDDWSFIVQHLDDIPAASTDCLVIVDVEVRFPL